jgi:hypothetical protein
MIYIIWLHDIQFYFIYFFGPFLQLAYYVQALIRYFLHLKKEKKKKKSEDIFEVKDVDYQRVVENPSPSVFLG